MRRRDLLAAALIAGIVSAVLALLLNTILLLAALAYFGATLTLPGIAGIILTVGMAVDSNVLIFERIREERSSGKSAAASIALGFRHVFRTLLDTHLAALLSAGIAVIRAQSPGQGA